MLSLILIMRNIPTKFEISTTFCSGPLSKNNTDSQTTLFRNKSRQRGKLYTVSCNLSVTYHIISNGMLPYLYGFGDTVLQNLFT